MSKAFTKESDGDSPESDEEDQIADQVGSRRGSGRQELHHAERPEAAER